MVIRFKDVFIVGLVVTLCFFVADLHRRTNGMAYWLRPDFTNALGSEYHNIAVALYHGDGFAHPFRVESGPTAWMPPVVPVLLAGLYCLVDGQRHRLVEAVVGIQAAVVLVTCLMVIHEARVRDRLGVGYGIVGAAIVSHFFHFFQMTDDSWWLMLVVDVIWLCVRIDIARVKTTFAMWVWGGLGGVSFLSSPIFGVVWLAISLVNLFTGHPMTDAGFRPFTIGFGRRIGTILIAMCLVLPWTIRNRVEIGAWYPIKSNLSYEAWQSLEIDSNGVLDAESLKHHPYSSSERRSEYQSLGEKQFVAEYGRRFLDALSRHPGKAIRFGLNRFLAATLWYTPFLEDETIVPIALWTTRLIHVFPFLAALFLLADRKRLDYPTLCLLLIYIIGLAPYIVISYTERYATPIWSVKALLVLSAADRVLSRRRKDEASKSITVGRR